ncbi:hypothetical protein D9M73_191250 [compost metagenome]
MGLAGADAQHLAGFQGAQQLALQRQRQVADLVQVEGAAVGRTEPAGAAAGRTAVGAGAVAEQFGIGVGGADCPTIDRDKKPVAVAGTVDLSCQQFLAGAGLTADQHGQGARRQLLELLAQLLRTWVDEYQGLGTYTQGAFVGIRKGQQRLAEGFVKTHGELPPRCSRGLGVSIDSMSAWNQARRRAPCSRRFCRRYR